MRAQAHWGRVEQQPGPALAIIIITVILILSTFVLLVILIHLSPSLVLLHAGQMQLVWHQKIFFIGLQIFFAVCAAVRHSQSSNLSATRV